MSVPKNILIVRTDRIGDVVLTLPLSTIIKKHFPNSKITFLLREYTSALAQNNPSIDEVIILQEKNGKACVIKNVKLLRNRFDPTNKFDACIVAYPTFRLALILFLSGIKIRIGTGYRWYSFLFNKRIYEHRKYAEYHELEYNVHLLKMIGINEEINPDNVIYNLAPSKLAEQKVESELKSLGISPLKSMIILHPGSGGSSINLPLNKMKELIKKIAEELDAEILITGNQNEKELCESLIVSEKTKNLSGKFDLSELIALINKCDILIANSTGPIHIAAALRKYVIGFYPNIITCSEKRWGPYTNKKVVFSPKKIYINGIDKQPDNMDSIDINEVLESIKKILSKISAK